MKIALEENDSFIQPDGIATMVVVVVTKDDGKVVRFPYTAMSKTLSDLISDVNAKIGSAPVSTERQFSIDAFHKAKQEIMVKTIESIAGEIFGQIKKEDLVKCVKLLPRDKDAPIDMQIGGIYRVLALPTAKISYFEVIDDTDYHRADIPRRVAAFPEEIIFFSKRKPPIPKEIGSFEEIFPCPVCQKRTACNRREDNKYHGRCDDCQVDITSDTVRQPVNV